MKWICLKFRRILLLLLFPFILCSCSKNNGTELVFASWGSITETGIIEKVIRDYEKENPDIKINFIHIPQNYFQKIHLLFASNQAPDIIFMNNLHIPLYADKLEPLDSVINKDDYFEESLKSMTRNGELLAVPRDISVLVFYRNKSLINTPVSSLEELITALDDTNKRINENGIKRYGLGCERDIYYMLPYVMTLGEDIYNIKQSAEFYKNLSKKYAPKPSDIGSMTLAQMFLKGEIALYLSGRWMYPKIKEKADFDWDVITFPGVVPLDSSGWAVSKSSKHKTEAKDFVCYLASKECSEYFTQTGLIIPARIDTAKSMDDKTFLDAITKSKAQKINKDYKKYTDKINRAIELDNF